MRSICDSCGALIDRRPSYVNRFRYHFCNRKCMLSYQQTHPEFVGRPCSSEKRIKLSLARIGKKFPKLSEAKRGIATWNKGLTANIDLRVAAYAEKQRGQKRIGNYVSGFRNPNWRGGRTKRKIGWEWARISDAVLCRDDYLCQCCQSEAGLNYPLSNSLDVHHLIPSVLGGDDLEDNLITLCRKCHRIWERVFYGNFPDVVHGLELEVVHAD